MRRLLTTTLAAGLGVPLFGLLIAHGAQLQGNDPRSPLPLTPLRKAPEQTGTCGKFGTSVEFVTSPKEAAARAVKEEKLVLVLHVSGLFEDPNLT